MILRHWAIGTLLLAYLGLATLYSVVTPIFEAPDELWHHQYVRYLVEQRRLPVLAWGPEEASGARQEASQPPLYYALAALVTSWVQIAEPPHQLNPEVVEMGAIEKKNVVLHTDREDFPYRGTALAVHLARWLSVLMGAGTVLATYRLSLEVLPSRWGLATAAAAFVAFNPMFLFVSGSVNNDNLVVLLCAWGIWLCLRLLRSDSLGARPAVLGGLVGLAALSKVSGLALLVPATAIVLWGWQRRSSAQLWRAGAMLWGCAAAVAGWWYARNLWLYGDPLGLGAMLDLAGRRALPLDPGVEGAALWQSFWALFGWRNILADAWVYDVYNAVGILALVSFLLAVGHWLRRGRGPSASAVFLLTLWMTVVAVALARWMGMAAAATQGRLLFPALSAIATLAVAGLAVIPARPALAVGGGVAGVMAALALAMPFLYIAPAYRDWPAPVRVAAVEPSTRPVEVVFGSELALVGFDPPPRRAAADQTVAIRLYWKAVRAPAQNYRLSLFFRDRTGQHTYFRSAAVFATSAWESGLLYRTQHLVLVPQDAQPGLALMRVGVDEPLAGRVLAAQDARGRSLGDYPLLARMRLGPPSVAAAAGVRAEFGGQVGLLDATFGPQVVEPGGNLSGTVVWKALVPMDIDYTVFVQLVGPGGLVAQQDTEPQEGQSPTSLWEPGETIPHPFTIQVPPQTPAGEYRLIVGLYELATLRRLPTATGDFLEIGEVAVR